MVAPGARAKSKQGHRIPLSTLALEILESTPHLGDYVFMSVQGTGPTERLGRRKEAGG